MSDSEDLGAVAREDFFNEAQEIIDQVTRDLFNLEDGLRRSHVEPDVLNSVFRSVHTLKGTSALFGLHHLGELTHQLEEHLDALRLGKARMSTAVLDQLFKGLELMDSMLQSARAGGADEDPRLADYLRSLRRKEGTVEAPDARSMGYEIDASLLQVLTEFEESRLRTNMAAGTPIYRVTARFPLEAITEGLETLRGRLRPVGELITTVPNSDDDGGDGMVLDLIVACALPLEQLRTRVEVVPGTTVTELARRALRNTSLPPAPATPLPSPSRATSLHLTPPPVPRRSPTEAPPEEPSVSALATPSEGSPELAVEGGLGGAGEALEAQRAGASGSHTVRVDIRRLDHLMNVLGELAIVRGSLQRLTERIRRMPGMREVNAELHRLHRAFDRNLAEMQSGVLEVRMVPLGQIFERLARAIRKHSRESGKEIRLVITGSETEVDKLIVEELSDPLLHIIRNSIDHGIEPAAERVRQGKAPEGTIALNAFQAGNHVMIEIEDDGAGISSQKVVDAAVRKGLLRPDEAASVGRREALNLIFLPGLSTREQVTDLSGRGVGLDVVKTNIGRLGGVVDVASEKGIGTKFTITLPITLAILRALLLGVVGRQYAIPLASVAEATVLDNNKVRTIEGREVMSLRGETLPLCRLDRMFSHTRSSAPPARQFVVVVALGGRRLGLVVDELFGQQDVVIKALGKSLAHVRGFAGATDLGDQRVGLVLDAAALLEEVLASVSDRRGEVHLGRVTS